MALQLGGAPAVPSKISPPPLPQTPAASRLKCFWVDLTQVSFRFSEVSRAGQHPVLSFTPDFLGLSK